MEELTKVTFSFKKLFVPFTTAKAIHLIVIIGFVVYVNSLYNGFVVDDLGQIIGNESIRSLTNIPDKLVIITDRFPMLFTPLLIYFLWQ